LQELLPRGEIGVTPKKKSYKKKGKSTSGGGPLAEIFGPQNSSLKFSGGEKENFQPQKKNRRRRVVFFFSPRQQKEEKLGRKNWAHIKSEYGGVPRQKD